MIDEKKLIERLEGISVENTCSDCPYKAKCDEVQEHITDETTDLCGATIKALSLEIVNQLAEEYSSKSSSLEKDLAVVQSIPSLYPLQPFEEEAVHRVVESSHSSDWIACSSGVVSKENEEVMLTFKNSVGLHVGEATYKNKMFFYVTDTEFGYYEEVYKQPIAWKLKDAPYQPKG